MNDPQAKNLEWTVTDDQGRVRTWEQAMCALLMDVRRELRDLNRLLQCDNFVSMPHVLRDIRRNTTKPKKKKKARP